MNRKQIIVDIDEDGNCSIEGKGFIGPECDKAISEIEKALGDTTRSTKKPEYRTVSRNRQKQTGGR